MVYWKAFSFLMKFYKRGLYKHFKLWKINVLKKKVWLNWHNYNRLKIFFFFVILLLKMSIDINGIKCNFATLSIKVTKDTFVSRKISWDRKMLFKKSEMFSSFPVREFIFLTEIMNFFIDRKWFFID